jgi:hypothetical protein
LCQRLMDINGTALDFEAKVLHNLILQRRCLGSRPLGRHLKTHKWKTAKNRQAFRVLHGQERFLAEMVSRTSPYFSSQRILALSANLWSDSLHGLSVEVLLLPTTSLIKIDAAGPVCGCNPRFIHVVGRSQ